MNLTFSLGAGNINNATPYEWSSPNMNSTYMQVLGNTLGELAFGGNDTVTVNDLTGNNSLQLNLDTPYLLIQAGSDADYSGLVTSGDINGLTNQDGYVLSGLSVTGGLAEQENSGMSLYLYQGDLEVVPEPGTWAMLLGGLGFLAFLRFRTRRALA